MAPDRVGRYELRGELGRGTMGVVYDAYDPALGRNIALKTVRLIFAISDAERQAFEQRFFAEARIAAHLSHSGIVVVHDIGRDPESGILYLALERLPGRTLADIVKEGGPMPWPDAIRIVGAVAVALHHAHSNGVIHRDIKPANIMILPDGQPKIMDFGIAHLETEHAKLTAPGEFLGTPLYMSPEQTLGGPLDARADVFSLGAIAYTLITGRLAFGPGPLSRIIDRVVRHDPPPPSQLVDGVPVEVDSIVARALAKSPADRYFDAWSLAEDADDVLAGRPPRHQGVWRRPVSEAEARVAAPSGMAARGELPELVFDETRKVTSAELLSRLARHRVGAPPFEGVAGWRRWAMAAALMIAFGSASDRVEPDATVTTEPPTASSPAPGRIVDSATSEQRSLATPPEPGRLTTSSVSQPAQSTEASRVSARTAIRPDRTGRLAVDFRHPLRNGKLRLWVDDELVLDQPVNGQVTKNLLGLKLYGGSLAGQVDVTARPHIIRVQVAWDDNQKAARVRASFLPGATRRLQIRLRRLPRDLSLQLT
jgi:eukaryotic-like serine/threonine-protein kinase